MKKAFYITSIITAFALALLFRGTLSFEPIQSTQAYEPIEYSLEISKEILLNNTFIGLEENPNRSISFVEQEDGSILMTIEYDPMFDELILSELGPDEVLEASTQFIVIKEVNEVSTTSIDLINDDEGLWFVFETDESGFVFDQIGYHYMMVPNE